MTNSDKKVLATINGIELLYAGKNQRGKILVEYGGRQMSLASMMAHMPYADFDFEAIKQMTN